MGSDTEMVQVRNGSDREWIGHGMGQIRNGSDKEWIGNGSHMEWVGYGMVNPGINRILNFWSGPNL